MALSIREEAGELEEESIIAEINITPLTDVFLVLLIIFMVTSSALVDSESAARAGVKVTLPKANAAGPVQQKRSDPIVTITKDGSVYLGPKKIEELDKLEAELRAELEKAGSQTVLVRSDQSAYVGKAVDVMSIAKKAGAEHIGILTSGK